MPQRKTITVTPDDPSIAHFWSKVPERGNGCWVWGASLAPNGYGRFSTGGGWVSAHRFAYALRHGQMPAHMEVHHLCENRACVNPDHLIAVTHRTHNVELTPHSLAAINAAKTHCIHGHEYTPETTRRHNGSRRCRTCDRQRPRGARRPPLARPHVERPTKPPPVPKTREEITAAKVRGALARAAALTPERRKEIGRIAAAGRWGKK